MLQTQNQNFEYQGEEVSADGQVGANTKHPKTGEPLGDSWVALSALIRLNIHRGMSAQEAFEAAVEAGGEEEKGE
jgi:hypothetical protein